MREKAFKSAWENVEKYVTNVESEIALLHQAVEVITVVDSVN